MVVEVVWTRYMEVILYGKFLKKCPEQYDPIITHVITYTDA